jgi:glutaredoxin
MEIRMSASGGSAWYSEMLKDPRWQKKRLEILQRDGWACVYCEEDEKTLHVHHLRYRKGKKPWEHEDTDLQTLCVDCHGRVSKEEARVKAAMDHLLGDLHFDKMEMIGLLEALIAQQGSGFTPLAYGNKEDKTEYPIGESYEHCSGIALAMGRGTMTDSVIQSSIARMNAAKGKKPS